VNYIHEPRLYVTFSSGSTDYAYTHLDLNPLGAISAVPEQAVRGEPPMVMRHLLRTTGG
jgi:hypothetical protein